ncbi:MAG TPA: alcohol dehydrogenase catalytic domain-containing protein, partial [Phycicoccus sp.]|nr:alcohol dehydrogenase catalytic domain-containing protein [Phycicoccus sp.]
GELKLVDKPIPVPGKAEVLVRIDAVAICATDLEVIYHGPPALIQGGLPFNKNWTPGHEYMGTVAALGPGVDEFAIGDRVTVEIIDTDAEGRMVLADGLCLAAEKNPDAIIDVATLTGAQMIALGSHIAGVMANDDAFRDRVITAAQTAGEPAWPMPLPEDLRKGLESQTADLAHKADRMGGMLTAGLFLQTFVDDATPWAHIDIAGPAFNEKGASGMNPKGGTGYAVSTLAALIEQYA